MKRWLRVVATLVVTALAVAYIVLKIDLGKTVDIIASVTTPERTCPSWAKVANRMIKGPLGRSYLMTGSCSGRRPRRWPGPGCCGSTRRWQRS